MKTFLIVIFAFGLLPVSNAADKSGSLLSVRHLTEESDEVLAAATLVIFNENDPESGGLAGFYAEKRKIPKANLIGLKCPSKEEITREEYDASIADPLRKILVDRKFWITEKEGGETPILKSTRLRFAVLMRGMPLKIAHAVIPYPGDKIIGPQEVSSKTEASVDSELCVIGGWTRHISGALNNPYFRSPDRITKFPMPGLMLVCRLDGPSAAVVRRMIEDSIAVEKSGLRGFVYVDARGLTTGSYAQGDSWLTALANDARTHGLPVIQDRGPGLFPSKYPLKNAALYFGWYSEHAEGALADPEFRFSPGAVAVHLHSFSASTLRTPGKGWCGPLVQAGAAATAGNVYEPFLGFTAYLDVLEQRLREGFTFAEAGYMSQRYLSWMSTFIGDPLYRPFRFLTEGKGTESSNQWDAYRVGVQLWVEKGRETGESNLRAAAKRLGSGIIYEGLGLLLLASNDPKAAQSVLSTARSAYSSADDKIRVAVHEAGVIHARTGVPDTLSFLQKQIAAFKDHPSVEVLKFIEQSIAPKPPEPQKPSADATLKPKIR